MNRSTSTANASADLGVGGGGVGFDFIPQLGKLKGMETFGSILSLCFFFRWFILLYSIAVAYAICHFIFRKSQTENGDFR